MTSGNHTKNNKNNKNNNIYVPKTARARGQKVFSCSYGNTPPIPSNILRGGHRYSYQMENAIK